MLEVQAMLVEEASVGAECDTLYQRSLKIVRMNNLQECFMGPGGDAVGFVGHGIGLEVDELPIIGKGQELVLEENMIVAVEPKAVFPDKGTVGIENMFRVKRRGLERLTDMEDRIIQIH